MPSCVLNGGMEKNLKDDVSSFHSQDTDFEVHSAGAHVTRWDTPGFGEMIFLSAKSGFGVGVPIRGGIPICFPWFGAPATWEDDIQLLGGQFAKYKHGFARKVNWRLVEEVAGEDVGGEDEATRAAWSVTYELTEEDVADQGYPDVAPFLAAYRVDFSDDALDLTFAVANTGDEPFRFEVALHTYFQVGDVNQVQVLGLDGVPYSDKVDGGAKVQSGPVVFGVEVDNVYQSDAPLTVVDPARDVVTRIETENSATTIVWNPGPVGAANMADMGDDEWRQFVCVETANALEGAIVVPAGGAHTMRAHYTLTRQAPAR